MPLLPSGSRSGAGGTLFLGRCARPVLSAWAVPDSPGPVKMHRAVQLHRPGAAGARVNWGRAGAAGGGAGGGVTWPTDLGRGNVTPPPQRLDTLFLAPRRTSHMATRPGGFV